MRRLLVFGLMLFALGVGSSFAIAGGGNSGNAKLCQKNGWMQVQTATGGRFATEDACVSYAAQGGILFAPTVTVLSAACTSDLFSSMEKVFFSAAGFTPSSSLTANIASDSPSDVTTTVSSPSAFDISGSANGNAALAVIPALTTFTGFFAITDGNGLSVTTPNLVSPCGPS